MIGPNSQGVSTERGLEEGLQASWYLNHYRCQRPLIPQLLLYSATITPHSLSLRDGGKHSHLCSAGDSCGHLFIEVVETTNFVRTFEVIGFTAVLTSDHNARKSQLAHLPSITPTAPLLSYYGCLRYLFDNKGLIKEGYRKVCQIVYSQSH